jgi:hypothetical protein
MNLTQPRLQRLCKASVVCVAAIGVFYSDLFAAAVFAPEASCLTYPTVTYPSPSGKNTVFREQEVCGDDRQTNVRIWIADNKEPGTRWSAFSASSSLKSLPLQFAWLGDDELLISFPHGIEVQGEQGMRQGVRVKYQEVAPKDRRESL